MKQLTDKVTFPNGATLSSRLVQPPMLTNSGDHGFVTQDTLDYYGARSNCQGFTWQFLFCPNPKNDTAQIHQICTVSKMAKC